ncbi:ribosomal RNA-processing protein 17-like [Penaeus monodon]|uniref:ribosomal RNA-processing protein 17-like n=1 Tax=Penaeus monodon TaxID=6687 RepID=UPI0018A75073|nr:ribosomal RNA-processing protein 17-like [Penaeus monodon]
MAPKNQKKKGKPMKAVNRQTKVHIKFDPIDRRKYLKGFHKRKEERRKVAQKQLEVAMKKEKRDIRKDRRELLEKLITYNEHMLHEDKGDDKKEEELEEEEEEEEKVTTTCGSATVEISSMNLSSANFFVNPLEAIKKNQIKSTCGAKESEDNDSSHPPEDESTPQERLLELGVYSQKDLNKSIKRTAFRAQQKSRLMQQKEKTLAREQKKKQAKVRAKLKARLERPNKNKGRRHCR